jgi:SAM-dependent methyltransferase
VPTAETAGALYSDRTSGDFQPDDSSLTARLKAHFARRDAREFSKHSASRRILDYGCGNGEFCRAMSSIHPSAQVVGTDYHDEPPAMLKGSCTYLPYSDLTRHAGNFDLVIARHVLEHTYSPIESLSSLMALLSPGGSLAIEVPCLEAGARHLFGKHWDGYYTPYHPVHFTQRSLSLAVEAAGFSVVEHGKAEMPKMGRSLQKALGCEYSLGLFALGAALHPLQLAMSLFSGSPTCLRIWATV